MKKLIALLACALMAVPIFGCQKKMAFERTGRIYTINDDGSSMSAVPQQSGTDYRYPDVDHRGERMAVVKTNGNQEIWTMGIDGGAPKKITPGGQALHPRWFPGGNEIAYAGLLGLYKVSAGLIQPDFGQVICGTDFSDRGGGFDVNVPQNAAAPQLIISRLMGSGGPHKLFRLVLDPSCPSRIAITGTNDPASEYYPAISISQDILVNVAELSSELGIRMRTLLPDGTVGPFLTLVLQGYHPAQYKITGLSMAADTNAIYVSAQRNSEPSKLYVVGLEQYLSVLRQTPTAVMLRYYVTPRHVDTGSVDSRWPSGIKD